MLPIHVPVPVCPTVLPIIAPAPISAQKNFKFFITLFLFLRLSDRRGKYLLLAKWTESPVRPTFYLAA